MQAIAALATLGAAAPSNPQDVSGAAAPASFGGTCQEGCAWQCGQNYPDDSNMQALCTTSCIVSECGGADYP